MTLIFKKTNILIKETSFRGVPFSHMDIHDRKENGMTENSLVVKRKCIILYLKY